MNIFYSTPTCYFKAVNELKNIKLGEKFDDFFPYADKPHSYWSGYFTSKPGLKGLLRRTSSLLQVRVLGESKNSS